MSSRVRKSTKPDGRNPGPAAGIRALELHVKLAAAIVVLATAVVTLAEHLLALM